MHNNKNYPISLQETLKAKHNVYNWLKPTPLIQYQGLSDLIGAQVYIKHENHNPTGSFKIRGGVNLMAHLKKQGEKGVITFSTGNHGISIATAASWFDMQAVVVVPENNNPAKNRIIQETGAELIEAGSTFEEASRVVESLCQSRDLYYVHAANEPHLINGVGTEFLEIIDQQPDIEAVIVPVGAGSEAAAAITTLKTINPDIDIYAVQAECSSAACKSWREGTTLSSENSTFAGGFATGIAYEVPFNIYKNDLADFILLSEEEIYQGMALASYYTHNQVEGAGSASIMAALKIKDRLAGKKVALQFSGCNASPEELITTSQQPCFLNGQLE
ncbi:pyridoxal-phosphate dependent enzyme [Sansalvadorimonas sp. 2012CJ34-2]|uniref:Pyridoxal-phosphate dependent enzyme n=1 Tax=Parendozoicomonas callyspongiae TaxID=2942213 RepID=A0ABT0PJP9_9GAMM|nr:pyridoxal-phosphate dependent enzyme [Sansalvadorimonas sp. 2012CJ34-2]MCL6271593.1 pyridoxal-phosphate dependent enzyme [Sansalvadorimonas sp. 2012CJ34-2]